RAFGESFDAEVRLMNAKQKTCARTERAVIVGQPGGVGRTDLLKNCAGFLQDFRDAESSADLDKFSTRDDDFGLFGKRIQRQHRCGGAIVDDDDAMTVGICLSHAQGAQYKGFNVGVSAAPLAVFEIELK